MAEVTWIKLSTEIFDNKKIKQIEAMPKGDTIIVIWAKLLVLAGITNDGGNIYIVKNVPCDDKALAVEFNRPVSIVRTALKVFEDFGMIEKIDGIFHITNWSRYQSVDKMEELRDKTRERVANYRQRKKTESEAECNVTGNADVTLQSVTSNTDVTECNAIDIRNKNIDIRDKNISFYSKEKNIKKESESELDESADFERFAEGDEKLKSALDTFAAMRRDILKKPLNAVDRQMLMAKLVADIPREEWVTALNTSSFRHYSDVFLPNKPKDFSSAKPPNPSADSSFDDEYAEKVLQFVKSN